MLAPQEFDPIEAGRRLGHDHHCLSHIPHQADWPLPLQEGFCQAAAQRLPRRQADRLQRKWLQLRLNAWRRGRVVATDVTPRLLQHLDLSHCPVTRQRLSHGQQTDTDASVDRLNNDGAYAASNLALMSVRANRAKGARSFEQVLALARAPQPTDGLQPVEWLRLAVLMEGPAFATRHHLAPLLPLCAPLPACSARLALQQIQRLFTLDAATSVGKNRLVRVFRPAGASTDATRRLRWLADTVQQGLQRLSADEACWDVWLQPPVMDALRLWRDALDPRGWALAAALSGQQAGSRALTPDRLRAWHLPTRGYLAL